MTSQFSPNGEYFAHLNAEGKLNVWNVAASSLEQEFTPDYHLIAPCTCLHFHRLKNPEKDGLPRKRAKRSGSGFQEDHILLGTNTGALLVYSIAKGDLEFDVKSSTGYAINCLTCDKNYVYSGVSNFVISWNLESRAVSSKWSAGPEKITAILYIGNDRKLLTANRNIKLWDVDSKEVLKSFMGHKSEITMLTLAVSKYFLSGSEGDRVLSCWNLDQEKDACVNFLMDNAPVGLSVTDIDEGGVRIAAVSKGSVVNIYCHVLNGKSVKPVKSKTTIQIASDDNSLITPIPIFKAVFRDATTLTVAHGSPVALTFEHIVIDDREKMHCLIRKCPGTVLKEQTVQKSKIRTAVKNDGVNYVSPHINGVTVKRKEDGQIEIPMEKRLENLTLNKRDGSKVPRNDNVVYLLLQGLQSNDKIMLKNVLNEKDATIIRNTIRRLPARAVVPLIRELTILLQGKTLLSEAAVAWLNGLIKIHTGLLLANPELIELFCSILATVENRLSLHLPLSKLSGKLDLLISQVSSSTAEEDDDEVYLVYNDDVSVEGLKPDSIDFPAHSGSEDDEWVSEESSEIGEQDSDGSVST